MTDAERRMALLKQNKAPEPKENSLFLRLMISVFCFICYLMMESAEISIGEFDNIQIIRQIEKNIDLNEIQEVWKEL